MLRVHVSRADLRTARAVDDPPSPLPNGGARLQLQLFGLSANNITYAAMGDGPLGYWDFFPAPTGWGCPPCWGFADVIESSAAGVATGMRYYGYYPIAETLDVLPINVDGSGFTDGAAHRAGKAAIYNRYHLTSADTHYNPAFEREQVLFRPVFGAGWWLADFAHRGNPETVVMSSATSKSALIAARQLGKLGKHYLIGLTSAKNTSYLRDTALYDEALSYDDIASLTAKGGTTYLDFLGRDALTSKVHEILGERLVRSVMFGATDWTDKAGGVQPSRATLAGPAPEFFFTPSYREARLAEDPTLSAAVQRDIHEFYGSSHKFVTIHDLHGIDAILSCWMRLLTGGVSPSQGLALQF